MTDYISKEAALVKSLRICAEGEHCDKCGKWELKQNGGRNVCEFAILSEAADAIEELSKYAETMMRLKCEGWYMQQTKFHDGYQAIATMPLPEPPTAEEGET